MIETESGATNARSETKSFARFVPAIIRVLLGLMFLVFGLNGFLNFIPTPKDIPQDIMMVLGGLTKAGYIAVVSGAEVFIAVLLLLNRFVPLALAMLAPIIVGIFTFHIAMQPATIGPAIVVLLMELYLAWTHRAAFRPMLRMRVTPGKK
jgi:uncharacterized membrane protein YphA (DoxX/SURF4 family)